ncbi:MAG: glycine cleavage system protein GcvH [Vampirovibrionales bacterium]|nr:glycine cleavage system protein GcvH [Vampirovibrionales bacterium]
MVLALVDAIPEDALLNETHEYVLLDDNRARVGISHYAAEALGDIVYVDLPSIGDKLDKGDSFGSIESVKAASDLYMPISGEIVAINTRLEDEPELVNDNCYGDGWMIEIQLTDVNEAEQLLAPAKYAEFVENSH